MFSGSVTFTGTNFVVPDGSITSAEVAAGTNIDADKLQHRHAIYYAQADGADVASETKLMHIARTAATVHSVELRPTTAPTGGDKQYTVDVQEEADAGSSWTSLLSSVITVDNTSVDNTKQNGTLIGTPSVADNAAVRVVVTASGSTGSQGQGFVVVINLDENGA